ncbi:hypothetical protein ABPG74_013288 [Tetrahymena malaccensis]
MSEQNKPQDQNKNKSGFLAFIGISQSTFINQQFNRSLWKCFNYYHSEFAKQYKANPNDIQILDFFESGQTHRYENMKEVEDYCIIKMKEFTDRNFAEEQLIFTDCRKECEKASSSQGKVMAFISNEKCYKRCRINFDKLTKEKVAVVFSKYVPELSELVQINRKINQKQEEDQKIEEIKQEYGKQ